MAAAAITYELLIASTLSYLLGATVLYFSLTIGVFLFGLGVGSWFSKRFDEESLAQKFVGFELLLSLLGGFSVFILFSAYTVLFEHVGESVFGTFASFIFASVGAEIFFQTLSFSVVFLIGGLVGLELPLLTRIVHQTCNLPDTLAGVFFFDYLGALVGSILFSVILFPQFGLLRSGVLVAMINIVAVVFLIWASRVGSAAYLSWMKRALVYALGAFCVSVFLWVSAPAFEGWASRVLFSADSIVVAEHSRYQEIALVDGKRSGLTLFLNGEVQFAEDSERSYHETFAHPVMSFLDPHAERVLVLGGGDGLLVRELVRYPSVREITLVDIDKEVTDLARREPLRSLNKRSLDDPRVSVVNADAFRWVRSAGERGERYDAIFLDFPDVTDHTLARLYSREFYEWVGRTLSSSGFIVVQSFGVPSVAQRVIQRTVSSAGYSAFLVHPPQVSPFGIPGAYEFGFTVGARDERAAFALRNSLENNSLSFPPHLSVLSSWSPHALVSPIIDSPAIDRKLISENSVFRPVSFSTPGGSLIERVFDRVISRGDPYSHFREDAGNVQQYFLSLLRYGTIFPPSIASAR